MNRALCYTAQAGKFFKEINALLEVVHVCAAEDHEGPDHIGVGIMHDMQLGVEGGANLCLGQVLGGVGIADISAKASGDAQEVALGVILIVGHPPASQPCSSLIP